MRVEIRCSCAEHAANKGEEGWDDGVLAISEGARIVPKLVCIACARQMHAAPLEPTKEQSLESRLAALESEIVAIKESASK
jgi:hypothetical protein